MKGFQMNENKSAGRSPAMEDVEKLTLRILDMVSKEVDLTTEEEDDLYDGVYELLQKVFGYPDYRHTH